MVLASPVALQRSARRWRRGWRGRTRRQDDAFGTGEPTPASKVANPQAQPPLPAASRERAARQRRGAVVAQAAGVDARRHEVVAEGVYIFMIGV